MSALQRWCYFLAALFTALALGPGLAHLFALPNKIGLERADYFIVQGIYRGWSLLAIVVIGALASTLALAIVVRRERRQRRWALVAFLCVVVAQVLFWVYTYPANQATANWTVAPPNWESLRAEWEYSHGVAAVFDLLAVVAVVLSLLAWTDRRSPE